MEHRNPLSQGTQVNRFVIDRVIGYGASCLVYEAHYLDSGNHRKEIILKECYPYNSGATRIGSKIVWSSSEGRDKAFQRFNNAYEIAAKIQNEAGAHSVSVYSLDKFEENGTQYVATIPNGNSYDKTKTDDIADIIRTALALTNAVGLYHKAGYLHLDIKPSNFIAAEDQTGKGKNIVLFDVDTVVARDNIQSGNLRSVSYSKEFAAPEQKMQQIKKLCPATDLYAVGTVLFERVMNRSADSSDSTLFATWKYDERFDAKKVNPKVKRLLTEIFHKTLAANVKRRYQSAEELATALTEVLDVVCSRSPYIISSVPSTTCKFVGRNEELAELFVGLEENDLVFVRGAGGIGKTELVKRYITIHQDEYDAVVFMLYNGSVIDCLNEVVISNGGDDSKYSLLKQLCNDRVLFVLDNFDVALDEDNGLEKLLQLNSKVIVTTRTDFSSIYDNAHFISISGLPLAYLRKLFENELDRPLSDIEFSSLKSILYIGEDCTYFWSMLARLAKSGEYSIREIIKKVCFGLDELDESERIADAKDNFRLKTTVAKAMSNLFKLDKLSDRDFKVLTVLYFLDCLNLGKKQIKEILSYSNNSVHKLMNSFNDLLEKGYIQIAQNASFEIYKISDVLKDVLDYKIRPCISKTDIVTGFIDEKLFISKEVLVAIDYDMEAWQDHASYVFKCLYKVFSNLNWKTLDNALYCINRLYEMLAGEESVVGFTNNDYDTIVINRIKDILRTGKVSSLIRLKIYIILITWSCYWTRIPLFTEVEPYQQKNAENSERILDWAIAEMENNNIKDDELLNNLCKPIVQAITHGSRRCNLFSGNTIKRILELSPLCLQNEEVHITQSFKVTCLINNEYEKIFLKETLEKIKTADDENKPRIGYLAIGFISLNSNRVPAIIDKELKMLRRNVFEVCKDIFFSNGNQTTPNLEKIDVCDFFPNFSNSEAETFKSVFMQNGVNLFYQSITLPDEMIEDNYRKLDSSFEYKNAIINNYPLFFSKDGTYSIDLLIDAIETIDSSDCLYYFITEYGKMVDVNCSFELSQFDKLKYVMVAKELEQKLYEILETGNFIEVFDVFDTIDYSEVEAKLNSIVAVMYDKIGNYEKAYTYMESVIRFSKSYLYTVSEEAVIGFQHAMDSDYYFWYAINRLNHLGDSHLVVPLLYSYIKIVYDVLQVTDETDVRMYNYYKELVKAAQLSLQENADRFLKAIFGFDESLLTNEAYDDNYGDLDDEFEDDDLACDYHIEKGENDPRSLFTTRRDYEELIEKYSGLINQMSGQEYNP